MTKRCLLFAAVAVSLFAGVAIADAATKPTKHKLNVTVDAHVLRSANNVTTWTGTIDGKIGHGAVRFTTKAAGDHFDVAASAYFPNGSIKVTGTNTATQQPDMTIAFVGKLASKSGTGAFKGVKGNLTFSGSTTKEDGARAVYAIVGTLTY
jgi:hypothetical protein